MTDPTLNEEAIKAALSRVIKDLDYDLWKEIENPEDPDDPDLPGWDYLAEIFRFTYEDEVDGFNE